VGVERARLHRCVDCAEQTCRPIRVALRGGDAAFNAAALSRLLMGEKGAYRDAVLLNAAGALIVAGEADDWRNGAEEAAEALDRGLAKALLDCWIATVR
jgi:anthranilate phosphoribosyltransferase